MRLIVGLGNPGSTYVGTRHNIGAQVLERGARRVSISLKTTSRARIGRGRFGGQDVALVVPLTWMNQSGLVVADLIRDLQVDPTNLIVIHDDLDLSFGRLRIKRGGGTGGHNGIRSVIAEIGSPEFIRVKIGIGRPSEGVEVADFVLSPFLDEEHRVLDRMLDVAVDAVECLVREGEVVAMNQFHGHNVLAG